MPNHKSHNQLVGDYVYDDVNCCAYAHYYDKNTADVDVDVDVNVVR